MGSIPSVSLLRSSGCLLLLFGFGGALGCGASSSQEAASPANSVSPSDALSGRRSISLPLDIPADNANEPQGSWFIVELAPEILAASRSDLRDLRVEVSHPARKGPGQVLPSVIAEVSWILRNGPRRGDGPNSFGAIATRRKYPPLKQSTRWDEAARSWIVSIETRNVPLFAIEFGFPQERAAAGSGVEIPVEVERALSGGGASPWVSVVRTRLQKPGSMAPSPPEVAFVVSNTNQHRLHLGPLPPALEPEDFRPETITLWGPQLVLACRLPAASTAEDRYHLLHGDRQAASPAFEPGLEGENQFLEQLEQLPPPASPASPPSLEETLIQLTTALEQPVTLKPSSR
jgi:hypothetical protein